MRDYGQGAEAKMRLSEKKQSPNIVQISEGRMRQQETSRYGSSVKSNGGIYERKETAVPSNPFENEYDPSNNPFETEDESEDDSNPFTSGYDCDKNLNPFS